MVTIDGEARPVATSGSEDGVQESADVAELCGDAAETEKSDLLSSVSWHPPALRISELALLVGAGAGDPSEQFALAPYPRRSTVPGPGQLLPLGIREVELSRATFPPLALALMVPTMSGMGNWAPDGPPEASSIR